MRVYIITVDDSIYIPLYLNEILKTSHEDITEVGILPLINTDSSLRSVLHHLNIFGVGFVANIAMRVSLYKLLDYLPQPFMGRFYSVATVCRHYNVPQKAIEKVNSSDFVDYLEDLDVDVVVSLASNQVFKRRLLDVPGKACLNVHSSLLPKYRGVMALFWAMLNGEKEAGVSVHFMNEKIDDGDILCQKRVPIRKEDSFHTLTCRIIEEGATALNESIKMIKENKLVPIRNDNSLASYYSHPTKEDVKNFYTAGRHFF